MSTRALIEAAKIIGLGLFGISSLIAFGVAVGMT